jgi:hypothetical protein
MIKEVQAKPVEIMLNGGLGFLDEQVIKTIRTKGFVIREVKNHNINLLSTERQDKMRELIMEGLNSI